MKSKILLVMLVLISLLAAGCNEEEKYNTAKNEYQQMREEQKRLARDRDRVNQVQRKLVSGVKVTPSEVRNYFQKLPQDSLPFVPEQVEVQIITSQPRVSRDEVERIENTLRGYAQRVNTGETEFATLARFYSQDEGSARNGGELGYKARGELVPEFANVAFKRSKESV